MSSWRQAVSAEKEKDKEEKEAQKKNEEDWWTSCFDLHIIVLEFTLL